MATSWPAFQSYQRNDAWFWEHLALTRACAVAGPQTLAGDIEALRRDVMAAPRSKAQAIEDLTEMRTRIASAKAPASLWDVKVGPGRLQDISLVSQAGALLMGEAARDVTAGLTACVSAGVLNAAQSAELADAYDLLTAVQMATRLLSTGPIDVGNIGTGGQAILSRATQAQNVNHGQAKLGETYAQCAAIIDAALAKDG